MKTFLPSIGGVSVHGECLKKRGRKRKLEEALNNLGTVPPTKPTVTQTSITGADVENSTCSSAVIDDFNTQADHVATCKTHPAVEKALSELIAPFFL